MKINSPYYTIKEAGIHEIIVKKSRFICQLKRVTTEKEAQDFIAEMKKKHYKATHNCSAFILRTTPLIKKSSDDGEPSGTAGLPMLEVLEKKQLTGVVTVTTRYFGGIKLGTGGLIRAYTKSVSESLETIGLVKGELYYPQLFTLTYSQQNTFTYFLQQHPQYQLKDITYGENLSCLVMVKEEDIPVFQLALTNLFHGKINFTTGSATYFETPV